MVIDLTPEQEDIVLSAAKDEGLTVGELVAETVHYVIGRKREEAILLSRLADAEHGDFLSPDQMAHRLQMMLER